MARTRVLLVDDHEVARRGLERVLMSSMREVHCGEASDAAEATALLASGPWDVVLLDLNLPGRGGLDLLAEAKRIAPRTPVLVVTACDEDEFAVRALRAGADGYVAKTSGAREILAAVEKVMRGGRYMSARVAERLAMGAAPGASAPDHERLSRRELQVLKLVAVGRSLKEIAAEMHLAERTIATYRARIGTKLGLSTNVQIARYAIQHHLVD